MINEHQLNYRLQTRMAACGEDQLSCMTSAAADTVKSASTQCSLSNLDGEEVCYAPFAPKPAPLKPLRIRVAVAVKKLARLARSNPGKMRASAITEITQLEENMRLCNFTMCSVALLTALATSTAHAQAPRSGASAMERHGQGMDMSTPRQPATDRYGYAVHTGAERTVTIGPTTRYLNVKRLEAVRINVAGRSIIWVFDTRGLPTIPLSSIIPEAGNVLIFVDETTAYAGG